MAEDFVQTNVNLTAEDNEALEAMMEQSGYENRSAFVRFLIRMEYKRRQASVRYILTDKGREVLHGEEQP